MSGTLTLGSGPDVLELGVAELNQPGGAQFSVAVDGIAIGTAVATADHGAENEQTLDVLGNFAPGDHTVAVSYLNPNGTGALFVDGGTINGNTTLEGLPQTTGTATPIDFGFTTLLYTLAPQTGIVEAGQSAIIGTAIPAVIGDTLSITDNSAISGTFSYGTLSLGAVQPDGTQPIIYTASNSQPPAGDYFPDFTVTDLQQGLSSSGEGGVFLDPGPIVDPTPASSLTPTQLQPGQTEVIATVSPGGPGDTLSLTQTAGAGSVALIEQDGFFSVVYTAPASSTSLTDSVSYTIGDQRGGLVSETAVASLASSASIPVGQINTPLVGNAGMLGLSGPPGQTVSETIAGYSLSLISITPSVTGGAGGPAEEESGGAGGNATLTIQHDNLGQYVSYGVTLSASATGGAGGASETEGPSEGGAGGAGGTAVLLANSITALLGGPTTISLAATGGAGGAGGFSPDGGGPGGPGSSATSTLSSSTIEVDGAVETGENTLTLAVTATGGMGGAGANSFYSNAGNGGSGGGAAASLTGDTLGAVIVAVSVAVAGGAGGAAGVSGIANGSPAEPFSLAGTPGAASITVTGNTFNVFSSTPLETVGADFGGTLVGTEGELSLSLSETSGGQTTALSAAPGGNLVFTGNTLTGRGQDTFALTLASGSYALNAAAGTISIAGSAPNTITGFDLFDMQGVTSGPNSFTAGTGLELLELGGGVTTVAVTPQSGSLVLTGATASDLVLDLTAFGGTFSLAQLTADTSETGGNEVIALPDGQSITVEGAPVSFTAANTLFAAPTGPVTLSPVTIGSGGSTLAVFLSERAAPAGAQFTIAVDGTAFGGVQTTTADILQGQMQEFDLLGNFAAGAHTVTIDYLNAANSLLLVDSATIDGAPVATNGLTLNNIATASFSFLSTGALTPVSVGTGPDTLALTLSERAEPAGAEFTISVDGKQIGGMQTTAADVLAGQSQTLDVMGNFAAGPHTATITYLNAANSLLLVDNATIDGAAVGDSAMTLGNNGAASFGFTAPGSAIPTIGTGSDALLLTVSERAALQGADFTISVDGAQIGGTQVTTADSTIGQTQQIAVRGEFGGGTHAVSIDYLNAANSLLDVDGASLDGVAIGGSAITLNNIGSAGFSFTGRGTVSPGAAVVGTGPDTLELATSQRGQPAGAQFTMDVDGTQIGSVQTTTANALTGQTQLTDVLGAFGTGPHTVNLNYLNAANSLLIVGGATIDGAAIAGSGTTLSNIGTESFTFTAPVAHI